MTEAETSPEILASRLAARILHDLSGPVSAVASGLELLAELGQEDDAALDLAASSVRSLLALLEFHRTAFAATGEMVSNERLRGLAEISFEGRRPRLEWSANIDPFPGPAAQATLILAQVAAGALSRGGSAHVSAAVSGGEIVIRVDGEGPRAALQPEALEGMQGQALSSGLAGRWAPSAYLSLMVARFGGAVTVTAAAERFGLTTTLPVIES